MHAQSVATVCTVCLSSIESSSEVFLIFLSALPHARCSHGQFTAAVYPLDSLGRSRSVNVCPVTLSSFAACVTQYVVAQLEPLLAGTTRLIRTVRVARRLRATLHGAPRARLATVAVFDLSPLPPPPPPPPWPEAPLALLLVLLIAAVGARSAAPERPLLPLPLRLLPPPPPCCCRPAADPAALYALPAARLRVLAVITSTLLLPTPTAMRIGGAWPLPDAAHNTEAALEAEEEAACMLG